MENKETAPLVLEDIIGKTDELEPESKAEQKSVFLDDYDDDDDDDDEELIKLEDYIENDILYKFHPEIKNINNAELDSLTKIKRDSKDNIVDENHTTLPILTRYEKAKVLGIRSSQINSGAEPFIDIPSHIIDGITIAKLELEQKAIPFIIRRNIPNGKIEYWNIEDLEII
tara:strand:- start:21692 stop:22204 length:513 start_codon:yes stop_codon:yes gene_type:complete